MKWFGIMMPLGLVWRRGVYKRERRSRVSYVAALWQHFQFFKFGFFKMQGIGAKKTKKLRKSNEFP